MKPLSWSWQHFLSLQVSQMVHSHLRVQMNKQIHSMHNYFICENTKHLHVLSINFLLQAKLNHGLISDGKHEQPD